MPAPYRETEFAELCSHCRAPAQLRCRQCDAPYCALHLAAADKTCSVCLEANFTAGRSRRGWVVACAIAAAMLLTMCGVLWAATGSIAAAGFGLLTVGAIATISFASAFFDWLCDRLAGHTETRPVPARHLDYAWLEAFVRAGVDKDRMVGWPSAEAPLHAATTPESAICRLQSDLLRAFETRDGDSLPVQPDAPLVQAILRTLQHPSVPDVTQPAIRYQYPLCDAPDAWRVIVRLAITHRPAWNFERVKQLIIEDLIQNHGNLLLHLGAAPQAIDFVANYRAGTMPPRSLGWTSSWRAYRLSQALYHLIQYDECGLLDAATSPGSPLASELWLIEPVSIDADCKTTTQTCGFQMPGIAARYAAMARAFGFDMPGVAAPYATMARAFGFEMRGVVPPAALDRPDRLVLVWSPLTLDSDAALAKQLDDSELIHAWRKETWTLGQPPLDDPNFALLQLWHGFDGSRYTAAAQLPPRP